MAMEWKNKTCRFCKFHDGEYCRATPSTVSISWAHPLKVREYRDACSLYSEVEEHMTTTQQAHR
jgi:hypothetical protein